MINKNSPAYPTHPPVHNGLSGEESQLNYGYDGITIYQHYAAKAMQALIESGIAFDGNHQPKIVAKLSYEYADAMIEFENNDKENK